MLRTASTILLLFQFCHVVTSRETAQLSFDPILTKAMKPCYENTSGCSLRDVHTCWAKDECLQCRNEHAYCFQYKKIDLEELDLPGLSIPTVTIDGKLLVDPYKIVIDEQLCLKHFAEYSPDCLKRENIDQCLDMCSPGREAFHMVLSETDDVYRRLVEQYMDNKGSFTKWYCQHGRLINFKKSEKMDRSFPLWDIDQEKMKAKHVWQASMAGERMRLSIALFLLTIGLAAAVPVFTSDSDPTTTLPQPDRTRPTRTLPSGIFAPREFHEIEKRSVPESLVATTRRVGIAVTLIKRPLAFDGALLSDDAKAKPEPAVADPTTPPSILADAPEDKTTILTEMVVDLREAVTAKPLPVDAPATIAKPDEPKLEKQTDLPIETLEVKAKDKKPSVLPKPAEGAAARPKSLPELDVSASITHGFAVLRTTVKPVPALDESNSASKELPKTVNVTEKIRNQWAGGEEGCLLGWDRRPQFFEQEARAFYGKTFNHLKKAEFGEAFDLVAAKLEHVFPGILSKELLDKLRASQHLSEDKTAELQNEVKQQAQAYFTLKAVPLIFNPEASGFLVSTSTIFNNNSTKNTLRPYLPAFTSARKQFNALSLDAQQALIKALPHLGMLDELEASAYVKVFDDIVIHLKGFCENLPGFEECDKVRAMS